MIFQLFATFFRIGCFTIGGGYAMIPLIEREIVTKRQWLTQEVFADMIALSQAAPGIIAVNIAVLVGWRVNRFWGAMASVLGAVLPSFVIILLLATLFNRYRNLPALEAIFKGIRPAVVAIIASTVFNMIKRAKLTWASALIPFAALALIWFGGLSPIWIIFGSIIITLFITRIRL